MYRVLEYFEDLQDGSYKYNVDDEYPCKGYTPTPERIEELSTDKNVRKRPLIKLELKPAKEEVQEAEVEPEEKPRKRNKKSND